MNTFSSTEISSKITGEIIPKSAEYLSLNEALCTGLDVDVYALINQISFEKSFSRLQDNYLIPLKPTSPDALTHRQQA